MKKYIQPAIKMATIKTPAILAGSGLLHDEKGDGNQLAKDNFIEFIGIENSEE